MEQTNVATTHTKKKSGKFSIKNIVFIFSIIIAFSQVESEGRNKPLLMNFVIRSLSAEY